jgi:hypothetical protein
MNSLEHYLRDKGLDETEAMNLLQEHGIVSDNCEWARDVGNSGKAMLYLHEKNQRHRSDPRSTPRRGR